jgi:tRNA(His) guanylyltransferase
MHDALGQRMKEQYEERTRYMLPRRTYTIIRVDGKAFHTFTAGLQKPFDKHLMEVMDKTAVALCNAIQGAIFAYTQSDEISILLTDFATLQTNAWFDGNVQKIASVSAGIATAAFNYHNQTQVASVKNLPVFDARVFTIPDPIEVENYFIWRQADATRNSIQAAAQALYSQKELHGKNTNELQEMMFQKGINWDEYSAGEKRGRLIVKEQYEISATSYKPGDTVTRNRWVVLDGNDKHNGTDGWETPIFTVSRNILRDKIYGDIDNQLKKLR